MHTYEVWTSCYHDTVSQPVAARWFLLQLWKGRLGFVVNFHFTQRPHGHRCISIIYLMLFNIRLWCKSLHEVNFHADIIWFQLCGGIWCFALGRPIKELPSAVSADTLHFLFSWRIFSKCPWHCQRLLTVKECFQTFFTENLRTHQVSPWLHNKCSLGSDCCQQKQQRHKVTVLLLLYFL